MVVDLDGRCRSVCERREDMLIMCEESGSSRRCRQLAALLVLAAAVVSGLAADEDKGEIGVMLGLVG